SKATSSVINYVSNKNSDLKCGSYNGCLFSDNHDAYVVAYIKSVNASIKSKSVKTPVKRKVWQPKGNVFKTVGHIWKLTGRTFTLVGNVCPLTRIATPTIVPPKEPILIVNSMDKPVVTLVYSRKTKAANKKVLNKMEPNNSWGSSSSNVPSSIIAYRLSKSSSDYGDYQIGNVTISRVYYVEGLGHNLFSVGKFCDSDLEVAFCQHTCFIRNLDGVDLLTGSRENNLYTLSLQDMMASSPICLLSKPSKTKSWLWHHRLSHLNFGAINHLARQGLVRGLLKLKFEKDHLCLACAMGKSTKKTHKPKSEDTNQEKLYLLHMDLCGPLRVESVNGKKTMATTSEQQVVLDKDLVPSTQRLRIGRSNFRLPSNIQSKESTLQLVYDVLCRCPFFKAFLVTADMPEVYMQEFWATTYEILELIRFLGYGAPIRTLTDININMLYQP
nr:integrase, catalytic region, zinc finger, CCHC-type, peptidase aspartic, catalytic [Tanacetum cinerariifolium]